MSSYGFEHGTESGNRKKKKGKPGMRERVGRMLPEERLRWLENYLKTHNEPPQWYFDDVLNRGR